MLSKQEFKDKYDISEHGFLSNTLSFTPSTCFLKQYLDTDINQIKLMEYSENIFAVLTPDETKLVYSLTSMLCHKYIWHDFLETNKIYDTIPTKIGLLWYNSAKKLGLPTVITHTAIDLYNWEFKNEKYPKFWSIDNLKCRYLMTNNDSEEWFYLIMILIEGMCNSDILYELYSLDKYINLNDTLSIKTVLADLSDLLMELGKCNNMMKLKCDPKYFYNNLRIYLTGSDKKEYFPNGVKIANTDIPPFQYTGGSAAQSPLIQVFDSILSVNHSNHEKFYLENMQNYMPSKHKLLITDLKSHLKVKDFIINKHPELQDDYNNCIKSLVFFRSTHMKLVHDYVIQFIEKNELSIHKSLGTGGTDLNKFLVNIKHNTSNSIIKPKTQIYNIYIFVVIIFVAILIKLLVI